ncbi:uncharacterized protein BO97DRAFT_438001 [Aspergillus homomorphus CBS 101889]|uniref:DUF6594 domain-containing protein n=1 Tax=Aspergillus homomorphus (strain CBS 101889) TaxID=1450537 RepID=A0A395HKD8_ASPHC|nr:hypothetical protein BO97DRAFT_438001 [Aspergillus homomorphus CBS 101889]RAL07893.1 hypothetical protein BO97DRAFT_438001 [Aspergillus homomorphus CBS 101889]
MALDPGSCIFRRFAKLNAKNLLYLQAELAYLQGDLDLNAQEDHFSDSLNQPEQEYPSQQWRKILEARQLLKEYNEALIQQARLLRFPSPDAKNSHDQKYHPMDQWDRNERDLISLRSRHEGADVLTRWVFRSVVPWLHRRWGWEDTSRKDAVTEVWYYDNRTIRDHIYLINLIIAGLLPATSMIILYYLRSTVVRLVVIFVYNILFVLVMGLMVKARKVDIFATAAAFAAVQVAMITSGNINS